MAFDLTMLYKGITGAAGGDMTKAVYDTDVDNRPDKAESVDDGASVSTAVQVAAAVTHTTSTGVNHANVVLNDAHRVSDGKNHSDVVLNNTHRSGSGADHAHVLLNTIHRTSTGIDHSHVVLNDTHRTSAGIDHSDVVLNNAHRISSGVDHTFIDQDVTIGSAPTFLGTNITGLAAASPRETNVIYVDPTNPDADFPTIVLALAAAGAGDIIKVAPGAYTEDIVIPADVQVEGPGVDLTGIITIVTGSKVLLRSQIIATATIGCDKVDAIGVAYVTIGSVTINGTGVGVINTAPVGAIMYTAKEMYVENGTAIGEAALSIGDIYVDVGTISIFGAGVAVGATGAAELKGRIDRILEVAPGAGTGISLAAAAVVAELVINSIVTTVAAYNVGAGSALRLFSHNIVGAAVGVAEVTLAAHATSNGSDHTYIDQSVISGATPIFGNTTFGVTSQFRAETAGVTGAILLAELTGNGTSTVTLAAPASLGADRTIVVPDSNVSLADINTLVALIRIPAIGAFGAEAGNVRAATIQIQDGSGGSLNQMHQLQIRVWDDLVLATPAVNATLSLTGGGDGVVIAGTGTNDMTVTTAGGNGQFDLDVTDAAVETVYITIEEDTTSPPTPKNDGVIFTNYTLTAVAFVA